MKRCLFFLLPLIAAVVMVVFTTYEEKNGFMTAEGTLAGVYLGGFEIQESSGTRYDFTCAYGVNVSNFDIGDEICVKYQEESGQSGPQYFAYSVSSGEE